MLLKKSFKNKLNRKGPRIDQWGTPDLTSCQLQKIISYFLLSFPKKGQNISTHTFYPSAVTIDLPMKLNLAYNTSIQFCFGAPQ